MAITKSQVKKSPLSTDDKTFLRQYLITALWSSTSADGTPLNDKIPLETLPYSVVKKAIEDVKLFLAAVRSNPNIPREEVCYPSGYDLFGKDGGQDFWLTRNGHGVGFWDRGIGDVGRRLTTIAAGFGTLDLYEDEGGKVYFY